MIREGQPHVDALVGKLTRALDQGRGVMLSRAEALTAAEALVKAAAHDEPPRQVSVRVDNPPMLLTWTAGSTIRSAACRSLL